MAAAPVEENQIVSSRSGLEKAAIVLLGLGDKAASQILQRMSAKSVNQLMRILPKINGVVESELESIMAGLLSETEDAPLFIDKTDLTRAMRHVIGEKRAST